MSIRTRQTPERHRRTTHRPRNGLLALSVATAFVIAACGDDDEPDDTDIAPVTSEVTGTSVVTVDSEVTVGTTLTSEVEVTETVTEISEVESTEPGITTAD